MRGKASTSGQSSCETQHHRKIVHTAAHSTGEIARALQFTMGITGTCQPVGDTQAPCLGVSQDCLLNRMTLLFFPLLLPVAKQSLLIGFCRQVGASARQLFVVVQVDFSYRGYVKYFYLPTSLLKM